jgi:hypothetical protein
MDTVYQAAPELLQAFHLMWDNFPETVTLVHKSREILAVNKAGVKENRKKVGLFCSQLPPAEVHKVCRAEQALKTGLGVCLPKYEGGGVKLVYWVPLDGWPEVFVHFNVKAEPRPPEA